MTYKDVKELIRLANDYIRLYNETGFINIYNDVVTGRTTVLMTAEEFFQTFGSDCEIGQHEGDYDKYYRRHIEDGVLFLTLMSNTELEEFEQMQEAREGRE